MAALAYVFPPLSGLLVYALSDVPRSRWHGLQSVVFGAAWPALIYVASLLGAPATRLAFAAGAVLWIALLTATALGSDPRLPGGRRLKAFAEAER